MPNEEVMAFKLTADSDDKPAHWMPNPSTDAIACDAPTDSIDFDEAEAVSIEELLQLHQLDADERGIELCEDCDDEIADML